MGKYEKLILAIMRGTSDNNVSFPELCQLLKKLGFSERIKGDHHIFTKEGVKEILNLQPKKSNAKPYQVKQVRRMIEHYKLTMEE